MGCNWSGPESNLFITREMEKDQCFIVMRGLRWLDWGLLSGRELGVWFLGVFI